MKSPKINLIQFIIPFTLIFTGGNNYGQLSNSQAEKVLKEQYPRYITKNFQLNDFSLSPQVPNELKLASERGLATYNYIAPGTRGYGCYGKLTAPGNQYCTGSISNEFVMMAAAKVEFLKVTGIREIPAMNSAEVEFTEKITGITPIGKIYNDIALGQIYNSTATFIKYNDGWRLKELNASGRQVSIVEDPYLKGVKLSSAVDSFSYATGIISVTHSVNDYPELNQFLESKAMQDRLDGKPLMSKENAKSIFLAYINKKEALKDKQKAEIFKVSNSDYIAENKIYLVKNKEKEGVTTTSSGLQYEVIKMGTGPKPTKENIVKVHYVAKRIDGTEFDSSYKRNEPAQFSVSGVLTGWTEGLQLMPVGSKFKFTIPEALAYGANGAGDVIKPYSTLIFEVELLEIIK